MLRTHECSALVQRSHLRYQELYSGGNNAFLGTWHLSWSSGFWKHQSMCVIESYFKKRLTRQGVVPPWSLPYNIAFDLSSLHINKVGRNTSSWFSCRGEDNEKIFEQRESCSYEKFRLLVTLGQPGLSHFLLLSQVFHVLSSYITRWGLDSTMTSWLRVWGRAS